MNNPPITTTLLACLAYRYLQVDKALGLAQPGRQTRLLLQGWFQAKQTELGLATINAATLNASIQAGRQTVAQLVKEAESASPERLTEIHQQVLELQGLIQDASDKLARLAEGVKGDAG